MISSTDLVALLVLGVLLPGAFVRPAFLREAQVSAHARMRWDYCYSMFAFGVLGFVDVAALRLLKPSAALSGSARGALTGAAIIVVAIVAAVHLPPILQAKRRRFEQWTLALSAILFGLGFGGFLAVDLVYPKGDGPLIALASWVVLLVLSSAAAVWFSGLSPETRLSLYRRRRKKRVGHRRP